jgi:hypothetical protein
MAGLILIRLILRQAQKSCLGDDDDMSIHTIYRACIWLPIVVPALLILMVNAFGLRLSAGIVGEMLAYSLIWGGLPYVILAVWATWWVGGRTEAEIRRLMFRAPLLMVAVFVPLTLLVGLVAGAPGPLVGVGLLGAVIIVVLGYVYVGVTVVVRDSIGPARADF